MKRILIGVALSVMLASCASVENYNRILDAQIGRHADTLVERYGPPDAIYELSDGRTVMQWKRERQVVYDDGPYIYPSFGLGVGHRSRGFGSTVFVYGPPTLVLRGCVTRFTVSRDKIIQSWAHEGDDCRATAAQMKESLDG